MHILNESLKILQETLQEEFDLLSQVQSQIKIVLQSYSDGKLLKGDEVVGWLGEVYAKLLLKGQLEIDDTKEWDVIAHDGRKVSVKARKGTGSNWKTSSAIPKIEGDDCPTHLMFIHLNNDYSIDRIWLFPWNYLLEGERFKEHKVHGEFRSYIFRLSEKKDAPFLFNDI